MPTERPLDASPGAPATMSLERDPGHGEQRLRLAGTWRQGQSPSAKEVGAYLEAQSAGTQTLRFDLSDVTAWDTSLPMILVRVLRECEQRGQKVDRSTLPPGIQRLMDLSLEAPEETLAAGGTPAGWLTKVGERTLKACDALHGSMAFVGEVSWAMGRFLRRKSSFRWRDFFVLLEENGMRALGIVGLISFLTGLILAFVGAVQLRIFGAELYVADLVGLAMAREMGALMTGVIMAGRSGAAFAASIGTMKVSEEIDALTTFGFHPVDMLVLPRLFAMVLMMPLLCLYADLIGFLGGGIICAGMLEIGFEQYFIEMRTVVTVTDISLGVAKSAVFGFLIAASGCLQGMQCGGNAAAVGQATTRAVVYGIVLIVVADAIFAVFCDLFGI